MKSLRNEKIQNKYVSSCKELWERDWKQGNQEFNNILRRNKLIKLVNKALKACDVTKVESMGSMEGVQPQLHFTTWRLEIPEQCVKADISVDTFEYVASIVYHEARHAEQWFRILEAIYAGDLPLPGQQPGVKVTTANLAKSCGVLLEVSAEVVEYQKGNYAENRGKWQKDVTSWYQSIYGAGRPHRDGTLLHMSWDPYHHGRPCEKFQKYLNLAEERDAYLAQDEVFARLQVAIEPHAWTHAH